MSTRGSSAGWWGTNEGGGRAQAEAPSPPDCARPTRRRFLIELSHGGRMMDTATAARAVEGRLLGANVRFTRVATDSRALAPGDLFVALKGERFDGHDFVETAREKGAVAALVALDRACAAGQSHRRAGPAPRPRRPGGTGAPGLRFRSSQSSAATRRRSGNAGATGAARPFRRRAGARDRRQPQQRGLPLTLLRLRRMRRPRSRSA